MYNTLDVEGQRGEVPKAAGGPGGQPPAALGDSVAEWAKAMLGFEADPMQQRVLEGRGPRGILNCTRQWGKSTTTAVKAVHQAYTAAESLTLVLSPSARQSGEFVRKASAFLRRLKLPVKGDGDNEISLAFPNGSRIVGLPGSEATVRGFSAVSLLVVDEASRVSDELYYAVRPMLAVSQGSLWLMSTPFGKRGFFWETWERGGPEWVRIRVTAHDCPRIRRDFLEEERRTMGDRIFRREYLCEFSDAEGAVFERDLVQQAITDELTSLKFRWL